MNTRALLLLLLPAMGTGQTVAATAPTTKPAEWRSYDVLLEFSPLPRTYSCDELWYKVRDVLLQLGARAYMTITPYDCGTTHSGEARSPRVEVKFQMPAVLSGSATRYAQITVSERAVHLAPGAPSSLQAADCELMRQMQDTLLAGLPVHVTTSDFHCTAAAESFALTIEAPLPAQEDATPRS